MKKSKKKFNYKHSLGQNFIVDEFLLDDIVENSGIEKNDFVLEIGPGNGAMTKVLSDKAKYVVAVEIDKSLLPLLRENLKDYNNISIINADFLNYDFKNIINEFIKSNFSNQSHDHKTLSTNESSVTKIVSNESIDINSFPTPIKVVANIPYYITSPIIQNLLQNPFISEMTLMVQKEVAERIVAIPSNKDYGILTLACNYFSNTEMIMIVSKNCFFPKPKVDSAVVHFVKKSKLCIPEYNIEPNKLSNSNHIEENNYTLKLDAEYETLFKLIKASFAERRKKLLNSLDDAGFDKKILQNAFSTLNFDENVRAENLSLEDYINLSHLL